MCRSLLNLLCGFLNGWNSGTEVCRTKIKGEVKGKLKVNVLNKMPEVSSFLLITA